MNTLTELGRAIVGFPAALLSFAVGLVYAILTEAQLLSLTIFGIVAGFVLGWDIALLITTGLYAVLKVVSDWVSAVNEQINFHARVIRDNRIVEVQIPETVRAEVHIPDPPDELQVKNDGPPH